MPVSRLTLAEILKTTPGSSVFGELVASSRFYGLTTGGINATEFALTTVGKDATGEDAERRVEALKAAVLNVPPYKAFFEHFVDKKVPGDPAFAEFLRKYASVPSDRVEECMEHIIADAETAGLLRSMGGGKWVDMTGFLRPRRRSRASSPMMGTTGRQALSSVRHLLRVKAFRHPSHLSPRHQLRVNDLMRSLLGTAGIRSPATS